MKIAIPVSQYFTQLKKNLLPFTGGIFVREEKYLDKRLKNKDIIFHANGFINDSFDRLVNNRKFLKKLNSYAKLLSFDLGPSCSKVDCPEGGFVVNAPVLTEKEILRIADKKISNIRRHFKGLISVENLDYHPSGAYEVVCMPEFICKFAAEFNVGLTLDIGHAEVTCNNLSMDIYDYLKGMPLSKVAEVHLTHSPASEDLHLLPTEKEYKILDFVLKRNSPDYIVIEYYQSPEGIIRGNRELIDFLKERGLYEN